MVGLYDWAEKDMARPKKSIGINLHTVYCEKNITRAEIQPVHKLLGNFLVTFPCMCNFSLSWQVL